MVGWGNQAIFELIASISRKLQEIRIYTNANQLGNATVENKQKINRDPLHKRTARFDSNALQTAVSDRNGWLLAGWRGGARVSHDALIKWLPLLDHAHSLQWTSEPTHDEGLESLCHRRRCRQNIGHRLRGSSRVRFNDDDSCNAAPFRQGNRNHVL